MATRRSLPRAFEPLKLQDLMQAAGMTAEGSLVACQGDSRDDMAKPCRRIATSSFLSLSFDKIFGQDYRECNSCRLNCYALVAVISSSRRSEPVSQAGKKLWHGGR